MVLGRGKGDSCKPKLHVHADSHARPSPSEIIRQREVFFPLLCKVMRTLRAWGLHVLLLREVSCAEPFSDVISPRLTSPSTLCEAIHLTWTASLGLPPCARPFASLGLPLLRKDTSPRFRAVVFDAKSPHLALRLLL
ncbi:hypothetical protein ACLB2K_050269 [Fragaria x ananassa]